MRPFHTIAVPHRDILEGRLSMNFFAADLWRAYEGTAPEEYSNPDVFFHRTYITEGMKKILNVVERRLEGEPIDPVIQLQTPFGGGKTHTLIALMHRARQKGVRLCVLVGTNLEADRPLWSEMESQLTGNSSIMKGLVAPGTEQIRALLEAHKPLLILIDEPLHYVVRARGKKVGDTTLAAQTLAFFQSLTQAVATTDRVSLVVTLPASVIEVFEERERAEELLIQIQRIFGRVEKIYTPVSDHEIASVVRKRLFSHVNMDLAREIVRKYVDYLRRENLLPQGIEPSEYEKRFLDSYPFLPEVLDVLYHQWGSLPTFQRTRGVLRLLSLVIYDLRESQNPYISLADFNLNYEELRRELINHIGNQFDSVIAQDITDSGSGSRLVDTSLAETYRGLKIGTRSATTIFMYSFSGGQTRGATLLDIKRHASMIDLPSSVVLEAVEKLKEKLFYLHHKEDRYFFSTKPNITRMILTEAENIQQDRLIEEEKRLIGSLVKGKLKTYIWEENPSSIPDNRDLKLVILREKNEQLIKKIFEYKGENTLRTYINTLFILCPTQSEHAHLIHTLRKYLAVEKLKGKNSFEPEEKKILEKKYEELRNYVRDAILGAYQLLILPEKDKYREEILGMPAYSENKSLDERVYDRLKSEGIIVEKLSPLSLKVKYLEDRPFVFTSQLLEVFYRTPGEPVLASREILERCIIEGVENGYFALGRLENNEPRCLFYKEKPEVSLDGEEILIREDLCQKSQEEGKKEYTAGGISAVVSTVAQPVQQFPQSISEKVSRQKQRKIIEFGIEVNSGKFSDILRAIRGVGDRGEIRIFMRIECQLLEEDYDKIKETLNQLGIEYTESLLS